MNSKPTHFLINGKTFPSLDGIGFYAALTSQKVLDFLRPLKSQFNGKQSFEQKKYGEVIVNVRTIHQIMSKWGRSNDKCIF